MKKLFKTSLISAFYLFVSTLFYFQLIGFGAICLAADAPLDLESGSPVDVAPWAEKYVDAGDDLICLQWEDPRDLFKIVAVFSDKAPEPSAIKLQWWQSVWPEQQIPRDRPIGAGESGWLHLGDNYQGKWVDADAEVQTDGQSLIFTFRPLNAREFPRLHRLPVNYRTTLKIRLKCSTQIKNNFKEIHAYTDSTWDCLDLSIDWSKSSILSNTNKISVNVFNGWSSDPICIIDGKTKNLSDLSPQERVSINSAQFNVWYTKSGNPNSFDTTVVTIKSGTNGFSFSPADIPAKGTILSKFYDIVIQQTKTKKFKSYSDAIEKLKQSRSRSIYDLVFDESEQSLERALREQPPKKGNIYMPLGTEGGRQRFGIQPDGNIFCVNDRIDYPVGRDTGRLHWDGNRMEFDLGLPNKKPIKRELEEQCLPIIHTVWEDNGIRYTQTAFVTRLTPGDLGFPGMQSDDTAVLIVKIHGENLDSEYRVGKLNIKLNVDGKKVPLILDNDLILALSSNNKRLLRAAVQINGTPSVITNDGQIAFSGNMPPGATGYMIIKIPFITLENEQEISLLRNLDYDAEFSRVKNHWKKRIQDGSQIITPVAELNNFYKAHLTHLLINCVREVGSDRYMARVGSFSYGVYGNESSMMVADLDRRGFHKEAERCLQTWLDYQGTVALPGDYSSKDGIFYGANGWESGGYNQHHGWIMWAMAEHYALSGDQEWLNKNASKLVQACKWIKEQRSRTLKLTGYREIERGLLPPGSLEDIGDWRVWLSNNLFSWWGMKKIGHALAYIKHPDANWIIQEADDYAKTIISAFNEASMRSPLVPLKDNTWIPQIPSEVHRRGRCLGWITTTLEGPIYMLRTGLIGPHDPIALPILMDYEDNLYLSDQFGYPWSKYGKSWFSCGGFSMQPNLLCSPHPYLLRDEIKHFLRAFFNAFASCYYTDTQMLCEHPLPDLGDWRGDHFKSSDESNAAYWLRLMFIDDDREDDLLRLGMAIPRAWFQNGQEISINNAPTHFGLVSLKYISNVSDGYITAHLKLLGRQTPKSIIIRFRHPNESKILRAELNNKSYSNFNPEKEWVILDQVSNESIIKVFYQ